MLSTPSCLICVVLSSITTSVSAVCVIASDSSVNDRLLDTAGRNKKKKVCRKLDKPTCFICIVLGIAFGSLSTLFYLSYHSGPLNESCWTDWSSGGVHLHSLPPKADLRLQDIDIGTFCTLGVKITPLRLQRYTVYHMEYRPGDVNRVTDTDD